jgi:hypothetical protein
MRCTKVTCCWSEAAPWSTHVKKNDPFCFLHRKGKRSDSNTSHEKPFNKLYAVILCDINIVFMYGYTYKILLFNTQLYYIKYRDMKKSMWQKKSKTTHITHLKEWRQKQHASTYLSKGLALLLVCAGRICWYSLWGLYLKMQHMHIQNHTNTFQQKRTSTESKTMELLSNRHGQIVH